MSDFMGDALANQTTPGSGVANSLASFLFQGSAPIQSDVKTTQQPLWLQQALYNTIGAAGQLTQQPYQPFGGPQVATPSDQTTQAWKLAGQNVGAWAPYLNDAGALTRSAGAPIGAADIQQFLNPYQSYITGALNRNLTENLLPNIQDKFVSAGQSRSPQESQITSNALRDTQEAVGNSLAGGYQGALNSLLQSRQQTGQVGAQLGQLGALSQEFGAGDVSQLAAAGQGQDILSQANINAALGNFQNQQQYPYQQLGFLSNIIRGLPSAGSVQTQQTTNYPQQNAGITNYLGGANALSAAGYRRGGAVMPSPFRGALSYFSRAA